MFCKIVIVFILLLLFPFVYAVEFESNRLYVQKLYRENVLKGTCFNSTVSLTPSFAFYTTGSSGVQPVAGTYDLRWELYDSQSCAGSPLYNESYTDAIIDGFLNTTMRNLTIVIQQSSLNMTQINSTIGNYGALAGLNSTYNQTYHDMGYNHTSIANSTIFNVYNALWGGGGEISNNSIFSLFITQLPSNLSLIYNYTSPTNISIYGAYGSQWYNHTSIANSTIFNVYNALWSGGGPFISNGGVITNNTAIALNVTNLTVNQMVGIRS